MNKNNITHPENMNTEDTKKEMTPSAFPPKENGEHSNRKSLSIAFIIVLVAVLLFTVIGMILMRKQPLVLQGQVETTEIRISGKLPGRIDTFLVREGDWVKQGDTLVVINSPTIEAKYRQVDALEQVAVQQNPPTDHCHGTATLE